MALRLSTKLAQGGQGIVDLVATRRWRINDHNSIDGPPTFVPRSRDFGVAGRAVATGAIARARPPAAQTSAACFQSEPTMSCPPPQVSRPRAETLSRPNPGNSDTLRPRPLDLKALAPKAPPRPKSRWHICKRKTRCRNAGYASTRDRAADRA